eukprot:351574-Chlamydomonas_euryale.AAC.1
MSDTAATRAIIQQLPASRGTGGWASPDATLRGAAQSRLGAAAQRSRCVKRLQYVWGCGEAQKEKGMRASS